MRSVRASLRLVSMCLFTFVMYSLYVLSRITKVVSSSWALKTRSACFSTWSHGVCRILGARVHVVGVPPRAPFFLVSNHLSYIDIVVLASRLPCFFVAKSEVATWPILGHLASVMNTVFVDRARATDLPRVVGRIREGFHVGLGAVFFPEGTSSDGSEVLPFRPPLFEAPVLADYPVCCASLRYRTATGEPDARESVCWWGDMTFGGHFWDLMKVTSFDAFLRFGESVRGQDRKELAREAEEEVRTLLERAWEERAHA